jgi:hypothetical protein
MMLSKYLIGSLLAAPISVDAFTASHSQPIRKTVLSAIKNNHDREDITSLPHALRTFVATSAVTLSLLVPTTAFAQETSHALPTDNAIHSSTVTLSEIIKTMDFSLPSSYDSIADPVASGTDELTTSSVKGEKKKVEKKKTSPKQKAAGNKGIALPSFGGGGGGEKPSINSDAFRPKSVEEKAAFLAEQRAAREQAKADAAAAAAQKDKEAAAERDANIKAARMERIAKREEEEARKAAEESAKREEMFKDVKVVDTSMPQY